MKIATKIPHIDRKFASAQALTASLELEYGAIMATSDVVFATKRSGAMVCKLGKEGVIQSTIQSRKNGRRFLTASVGRYLSGATGLDMIKGGE